MMQPHFATTFGYEPRDFQIEVAKSVFAGKPTLLRAPTGFGKTAAAEFPFFYATSQQMDFPRQMIYALPLRVLANSLFQDAVQHSRKSGQERDVRLQTGEFRGDDLFLGDLTFTTYDQLISGFLHTPLSQPFRLANVLAGAAISSYLVWDEIHLMEMSRALGTSVGMLQWIKDVTPSLMMTATMTNCALEWLQSELDATVVQLTPKEINLLPKSRRWHRISENLSAQRILEEHNEKRTIVVANTVDSAQKIYRELRELLPADVPVILLHSRFFRAHRKHKEEQLLRLFARGASAPAVLVATQVIEVGLNISCDNLHSEIAPANSLIQRAGRCARFEGEHGRVWIYDAETAQPYAKELVEKTNGAQSALWNHSQNGEPEAVRYDAELEWAEEVHAENDKAEIALVGNRKKRIFEVIAKGEQGAYEELVRKIDALSVVITPEPESLRAPRDLEGLSLRAGTLKKHLEQSGESSNIEDDDAGRWFAKKPCLEVSEDDAKKSQNSQPPSYEWWPISQPKDFDSVLLVALNPRFVSYSIEMGLLFKPSGDELGLSPCVVRPERERYSYERETYEQHIHQVWKACERHFWNNDRLKYAASRLEKRCELKAGDFEKILRLVISFHDVGKLSQEWQDAVWGYHRHRWNETPTDFLAHTKYNPADKADFAANKRFSRPPHAAESAVLTREVWDELGYNEEVSAAAFSAIARHHAPFIKSASAQKLAQEKFPHADALQSIVAASRLCGAVQSEFSNIAAQCARDDKLVTSEWLIKPEGAEDAFLLYLVLVRALRISDQFSFQEA